MRERIRVALMVGTMILTGAGHGQITPATQPSAAVQAAPTKLVFDVASVRPSAPPDMAKMMTDLAAGKRPDSVRIDGTRATFVYNSLKQLVAYAYKMRNYEISGPEWLATDRFDIQALLPDGTTKDDTPAMLQALLAERFKLAAHVEMSEQPVLALLVAKGGAKLQPASATAEILDETAPLKAGESLQDTRDGRIKLRRNSDGSTTYIGSWGNFTLKFIGETRSMHMQSDSMGMMGFAMMLNSLGGGEGRQVVDQTGLKEKYQVAVDFSIMDLMSSLHDQGINIPTRAPDTGSDASDPGGYATVSQALAKLGLRLEKSKAQVQRIVVDHVEKMPTDN